MTEKQEMDFVHSLILNGEIYASVVSVSPSGMSRRIKFYTVEEGRIVNRTPVIGWLSGELKPYEYKQGQKWVSDDGLKVSGCGMDMIFHTLYKCLTTEEQRTWTQNYNQI